MLDGLPYIRLLGLRYEAVGPKDLTVEGFWQAGSGCEIPTPVHTLLFRLSTPRPDIPIPKPYIQRLRVYGVKACACQRQPYTKKPTCTT